MNGINILIKDRLLVDGIKRPHYILFIRKIHFKYKISRWLKV